MPPSRHSQANTSARAEPYRINNEADKENAAPVESTTPAKAPGKSRKKSATTEPDRSDLPASYLDIELEEVEEEIPVYENCAAVRRKLNKLLESKAKIPGSNKTWNKTSLAEEIRKAAQNCRPVQTTHGHDNQGPSVNALLRFLKKSGSMGGGDTDSYYFGNVLLEKLRIWNKEKKTAAREKAEKEFPKGRLRVDPKTVRFTHIPGQGPYQNEIAQMGRGD